ncbi:MAG: sugar ABC transporter permease [Clostridia bacterium]
MSAGRGKTPVALAFLAPSLLGMTVFVIAPFVGAVARSMQDAMGETFVGLQNYRSVVQNEAFQLAVHNTLRFVCVCIPLLLILSLGLALVMRASGKRGAPFGAVFLAPMAIPVASVALVWQVFFARQGLLNGMMVGAGGQAVDWLGTDAAFWVLVLSYLWRNVGYDMVLWRAGLAGIDPAVYEAAEVDGAGALRKLRYITLPQLTPAFFTIAVVSLLNSFKVFREAYLIAGSYPHDRIYLLQHLFSNWFLALDMQKLCAAAVMVALVILVLVLALNKLWAGEEK